MAYSPTKTLLALDEYAKIMAIPGWLFNQVTHSERDQLFRCADIWYQSGYYVDPSRILGRDELAQAIALTENQIANMLRFWPAHRYVCGDEIDWPMPKRGIQMAYPVLRTHWGNVVEFGVERWELIEASLPVYYTDTDNDGILDWATVTVDLGAHGLTCSNNFCEIEIVPHGRLPQDNWPIRMLNRTCVGNIMTLQGWRWLFVEPEYWNRPIDLPLHEDNYFLGTDVYPYEAGVDAYRRFTSRAVQAQFVWAGGTGTLCTSVACTETCQDACVNIHDKRMGHVVAEPAKYDAVTDAWTRTTFMQCSTPSKVRLWYLAGYDGDQCLECNQMGPLVREAIVRLTNTHLPEAPCGCDPTRERWKRDREEMSIDSTDVELAQTAFGTTMRGAVFAYNVFSKLPPLGRGR